MKKRAPLCALGVVAAIVAGCSGLGVIKSDGGGTGAAAAAPKFDNTAYQANKADTVKSYTDVSKVSVLTESKKVIIPDFKVYFHVVAKGSATTGHALSGLGGGRQEARVSQKVNLAVDPAVFQQITDAAYADFVAEVKKLGYEVIEPKDLAAQIPEYKEYTSGDKMKTSPHVIDGAVAAYAPTGMKVENPGQDIGIVGVTAAFSAFGTTLQDVVIRAGDKLDAIRMQPVYDVGFAEISSEGNVNRAELQANQSIRLSNFTQIRIGEGWTGGYIKLDKVLASGEAYGKIVNASSATDKTRGVTSALGKALNLGSTHDSASYSIEADAAKYKKAVLAQIKLANELFFQRIQMENK